MRRGYSWGRSARGLTGLGLLVLLLLLLPTTYSWLSSGPGSDHPRLFRVPVGAGAAGVSLSLAKEGFIRSPWLFRVEARYSGADRHLLAGSYLLRPSWPLRQILATLASGRVATVRLVVPEGLTVEKIAVVASRLGLSSSQAFLQAAKSAGVYPPLGPGVRYQAEGYLYPATYRIPLGDGPGAIVGRLEKEFRQHFGPTEVREAAAEGLSPAQLITLASLVEAEARLPAEKPLVAAVFLNRLRIGMKLQSDATVNYAAGAAVSHLGQGAISFASPYNTYLVPGWPPGPIDNPGAEAIAAALHPAKVPYLFFVGRPGGAHLFASTYAEQLQNEARLGLLSPTAP